MNRAFNEGDGRKDLYGVAATPSLSAVAGGRRESRASRHLEWLAIFILALCCVVLAFAAGWILGKD